MVKPFILTIVGPDHPGIVDDLSAVISNNGGNWLESRMVNLAGQFAGVLLVECDSDCVPNMNAAVQKLEERGLSVQIARGASDMDAVPVAGMELEIIGPDHPGIVHDISHFLARNKINIIEMSSWCEEGAMGGGYIFHSKIIASVPSDQAANIVEDALDGLADELNVDITLDDLKGTRTRI